MGINTMNFMMKRARTFVALLFAIVLGATGQASLAQAQELSPEHLDLARRYIELTDKSGIYEVSLVSTAVDTMSTILRQNPDIADPVNTAIEKTLEGYKGNKGQLMDQFARVYALTFSMEELQQIVAFYESPVGSKLATANAQLNDSLQRVMQVFEVNLKQEFFAKVRAELKAAGFDV
jgi:hypothetical protein